MPSADQVPIKLPHLTMLRPKWVVLIAGSTGSALRAVRPPNLHITPVARRDFVIAQARELGKMGSDCIDYRGLLTDEHVAGAVEHQAALLLGALIGTNRMLALVTASQMASASAASFFCRLT